MAAAGAPSHSQAGQGYRGQGHSLPLPSPPTPQVLPIGQTPLKAREPVMQSMGPQSPHQGKEEWTASLGAKGTSSTAPKQWDATGMEQGKGPEECLKYQCS